MGHGSSIDSPAPPDDERVELATPLLKSRPGGTWSSRQFKLSVVATGGAPEHHLSWRPHQDEARTKTIRLRPRHFELTVRSTPCALHRLAHSGEFVRADSVGDASGLEVEAAFIPAAEPDEPQGEFSITVNEEFTLNLRAADVDTLTRWLKKMDTTYGVNHSELREAYVEQLTALRVIKISKEASRARSVPQEYYLERCLKIL